MSWDQFHLMITRSTTPELIVFYYRLLAYFSHIMDETKEQRQYYILELDIFNQKMKKKESKEAFSVLIIFKIQNLTTIFL